MNTCHCHVCYVCLVSQGQILVISANPIVMTSEGARHSKSLQVPGITIQQGARLLILRLTKKIVTDFRAGYGNRPWLAVVECLQGSGAEMSVLPGYVMEAAHEIEQYVQQSEAARGSGAAPMSELLKLSTMFTLVQKWLGLQGDCSAFRERCQRKWATPVQPVLERLVGAPALPRLAMVASRYRSIRH